MIDPQTIEKAANILVASAPRGSKVILFGSQATGLADSRSDVDFMVVEPSVPNRVREMLRLTDALRPLRLAVDVLVISSHAFEHWRNTPNSIAYQVDREGRVYGPST
jgi:predicted nucleotidyltransferase